MHSAFKTVGGFTSGIAIRYGFSTLVNDTHQPLASNIAIGERVPPQVFIRAASSQPIEVQDMLPADTRFKILVFAGDVSNNSDRAKLEALAEDLNKPESFLRRYGRGDVGNWEVFDVLCFSSGKKDQVGYPGERLAFNLGREVPTLTYCSSARLSRVLPTALL